MPPLDQLHARSIPVHFGDITKRSPERPLNVSRPEPGGELETEVLATLGLKEPPFAEMASDAFFFPSEQHLRALDFMRRVLCSRVSAGVVTADSGCGKSLLARYFLSTVDDRILAAHVQRIDLAPRSTRS